MSEQTPLTPNEALKSECPDLIQAVILKQTRENIAFKSECLDLFQTLTLKQAREKAYLNGEGDEPVLDSDPEILECVLIVLRQILLTTPQ